jgi:uncharacterized BrkB/YihY/UPF0761 family membrane protein
VGNNYKHILIAIMESFKDQVDKLQGDIETLERQVMNKQSLPILALVGVLVPFFVALVLYLSSPKIVMSGMDTPTPALDKVKLFIWTVLVSVLLFAVMGAAKCCMNM